MSIGNQKGAMHKFVMRNDTTDNFEKLDGNGVEEQPAENETITEENNAPMRLLNIRVTVRILQV